MRSKLFVQVTLVAILVLGWQANALTAQTPIKARQLKPPKANFSSYPEAINSAGDVVGTSTGDGCNPTPVLWKRGHKPSQMRLPSGDVWARVSGINAQGTAVGESTSISECTAEDPVALWCADNSPVVWDAAGKPRILASPAKRGPLAGATDINSLGEIVGNSYDPAGGIPGNSTLPRSAATC